MFRSRSPLPWVLAVILGLATATAGAAHRTAPRRPAAAPAATTSDEAFIQARQFAVSQDLARFDASAARVGATPLRPWLDYWRLKIRLAQLRNDDAGDASPLAGDLDRDIAAFLARHPDTAVAESMRRDWLLSLGRRGQWDSFDAQYTLWAPHDEFPIECWAGVGQLRQGRPLSAAARTALMQPRELGDACGTLLETGAADGTFTRDDAWHRLELALEGNAAGSVRRIAPLVGLTPGAVEAALQRPARVLDPGTDPRVAVIAFAQLSRQDPDAAAHESTALRELPANERAFAWSQIAANGMRKLAPRSLAWTREALGADASDDTWVWLARAALRDSDWRSLAAVIERMSPAGRANPAWVYWKARSLRELGNADEANALMQSIAGQFHFYGQLAAEDLGGLISVPARAEPARDDEIAQAARNAGFARALKFYDLGLRVEGNREWNYEIRSMNDRQLLAAAAWACRKAVLDRCVNTADRTRNEHDFSLRFVTPYLSQLEPVARSRDLDPAWVYGLIRQESRFIMDAKSSAGAHGLMQIIPPTARWIAHKLGERDFRPEHLANISTNIRFGTFYLKKVLDDLEGSPLLASAAYNAGPGRPRNWRATLPAAIEGAAFAEIIPFTETRDYVKKVLSNATYYSALLTGRPQSLKTLLGSVEPKVAGTTNLP